MKSKMLGIFLMASLIVAGLAVPGHAVTYWQPGDLIRVVYDPFTQDEVATDLGVLSSTGALTTTYSDPGVTLSQLGVTSWSQFASQGGGVAYFAMQDLTSPNFLATATATTVTSIKSYSGANFQNGPASSMTDNYQLYSIGNTTNQATTTTTTSGSYEYEENDQGATGSIGNYQWYPPHGTTNNYYGGEIDPVANSTVTQNIFEWAGSAIGKNQSGTLVGTIETIDTNGDLTSQYSSVPIPPSALLLLPGLLGLVGLRKKMR